MTIVYKGVISNYGFISPKEFLKLDNRQIALLEAILIDTERQMKEKMKG